MKISKRKVLARRDYCNKRGDKCFKDGYFGSAAEWYKAAYSWVKLLILFKN
jgi:hypothetical protein